MGGDKLKMKKENDIKIIRHRFFDAGGNFMKSFGIVIDGVPQKEVFSEEELDSYFAKRGLVYGGKRGN